MPNKILLDIACENLRKAIKNNTVTSKDVEIKKKWARMALVSSRQGGAKLHGGN